MYSRQRFPALAARGKGIFFETIKNNPSLIFKTLIVVFLTLLAAPRVFGQTGKPSAIEQPEVHGGIEIGSKGVKGIAIRVSSAEEGYEIKILYAEVINTTLMQTKDNRFTPEAIRDTAAAAQRLFRRMQQEYSIPPEDIHLVVSSGAAAENPQELIAELLKRVGQAPAFLDVDSEVQLTIAGAIPKRYRANGRWFDNRSLSVLIDIGSGNTKGGYQQARQVAFGKAENDYVTWGIPKGTVTYTNEIFKATGEATDYTTFAKRAQALSNDVLRIPLRNEAARHPGLINRKKVYLSGGIIWAVATLLHPEDKRSFTPLTIEDFNNFYNRAITNPEALLNPDLSRIANPALRQDAEREVESVRNTFTPKNLIAGAEILRAVSTEMSLTGKRLLFARFGHLAWILSYVRLQAEN